MKTFLLTALILFFPAAFPNIAHAAEMYPKQGATFKKTYVWDGRELKPKQGTTFKNTWTFDGKEWKLRQGANFKHTYVVKGKIPLPVMFIVLISVT